MARPIGYYIHHHGDGHRQRALAIAEAMGERLVCLGTGLAGRTGSIEAIALPDDRMLEDGFAGQDLAENRPRALHYAPLDHDGVRRRTAILTDWIARERPALMVVDVSAEVAMLARLAGTPAVYVRLSGLRDDPAHLDAFRGAQGLLAPFAAALDDPRVAEWVRAKTAYIPGITRGAPERSSRSDDVLVIAGAGGTTITGDMVADAARATPDRRWRVAGNVSAATEIAENLTMLGWVDDIDAETAAASVVIGGAGDGVVGHVLAAAKPFICIPEPRPFSEQASKAHQLAAVGGAIVRDHWPLGNEWKNVLDAAARLDLTSVTDLHDPAGAQRAASYLLELAERWA